MRPAEVVIREFAERGHTVEQLEAAVDALMIVPNVDLRIMLLDAESSALQQNIPIDEAARRMVDGLAAPAPPPPNQYRVIACCGTLKDWDRHTVANAGGNVADQLNAAARDGYRLNRHLELGNVGLLILERV